MYKDLVFKVVENGIIGVVGGMSNKGMYDVCFYENGSLYFRADVCEEIITDNLKYGVYEVLEQGR